MAYFKPSIEADGILIPTYQDTLDRLIAEYTNIFAEAGYEVYLGEETPDYQLLSVFAKFLDDYASIAVDLYNARNPEFATGPALDLLLPLNGMTRNPATFSTVSLTLRGNTGTVIPAGSEVIDDDGVLWETLTDATLPMPAAGNTYGEIKVDAQCEKPGAVEAFTGAINKIYTPIIGWDYVRNDTMAIKGKDVETDDEVRIRRRLLFSRTANGTVEAIVRSLSSIDDVTFVRLYHNDTNVTDSNGLPGHSICALVAGGEEAEIAEAIFKNKAPGVGTYGGANPTIVPYVDDLGYTNSIAFARPRAVTTTVTISLQPTSGYDQARVQEIIREAILDAINDLGIGISWNVTTAYRDIYNAFSDTDCPFIITSVTGSNSHGSGQQVSVQCGFDEYLTVSSETIIINDGL